MYTVQVLAVNDIGPSPSVDTGEAISQFLYFMAYFTDNVVLLSCSWTETNSSITFNCTSTIESTRYSITLVPGNMMGNISIGEELAQ